jgi:hypothetical protein
MNRSGVSFLKKISFLCVFLLTGCGGSGGSSDDISPSSNTYNEPEVFAVGQFKDSSVEGLSYKSGSISGFTDASGNFSYVVGQEIIFSVGGIELGRTQGKELITPLDITSKSAEALNIVRFLMMLDDDQNPENGIRISNNIQLQANSWSLTNWSNQELEQKLIEFKTEADAVAAFAHEIPSVESARSHLKSTLSCLNSGLYRGSYSSPDDNGIIDMIIDPYFGVSSGFKRGVDYIYTEQDSITLEKKPYIRMITENQSLQVTTEFEGIGKISGTWDDSAGSGIFEAQRLQPSNNKSPIIERYVSSYSISSRPHSSFGYIVVEIHSDRDWNTLWGDSDISLYGYDTISGFFRLDGSERSVYRWRRNEQQELIEMDEISIEWDLGISSSCRGGATININRKELKASGSWAIVCGSGSAQFNRDNNWRGNISDSFGCKVN